MAAEKGGAKRVELNSALALGGLTPSLATLQAVKKVTDLKVQCMVRVRPAGFCYDKMEKDLMFAEAKQLLENGADGIVFGFLREDCTIHQAWTKEMADFIHGYGKEAIFHRAFSKDIPEELK